MIYKSSDGGSSWNPIMVSPNPIEITALIFFKNKLYAGTFNHGVFYSDDNGISWQNNGIHPRWISEFAIHNSALFVSTLGSGVALLGLNSTNWTYLNATLPDYSINVNSIISSSNDLIVAAGSNGTYYRYDFNNSIWNEEYYTGMLQPGLQINKLITDGDTFFAVNGNRIIKSSDAGTTWSEDAIGAHNGAYRTLYEGAINQYTLTNIFPEGTWIQKRDKLSPIGSSWEDNEELLPTGFSYALLEFQDKLFLAKADGLYTKSVVLGVNNPIDAAVNLMVFPNPSDGKEIKVISEKRVLQFSIINNLGQKVYSQTINKNQFSIYSKLVSGVYFISFYLSNGEYSTKKIIVE